MGTASLLLVARSYPPLVGGMERYAEDLYLNLREIMDVRLLEHHHSRLLLPLFALKVLGFLAVHRRDFTHIHFCDGALAPVAVAASMLTGARVSITIHALDIIYARFFYQFLVPPCVRRLDQVVCVSRYTRDECVRRGVEPGRCTVIPNGTSGFGIGGGGTPTTFGSLEARVALPLSQNKVLCSVSRLIARKGIAWFVAEVMPLLPENYLYVVAGDGPERAAIVAAVAQHKLANRVAVVGRISEDDKHALFELANLYVMPNLPVPGDAEGFGISIIEAGARGLACVAARVEGIPDAVVEGRSGTLVPANDARAFAAAIRGADFSRAEVSKAVREHYDWKILRERYRELFRHAG